jgi:transglutaminase-like putative cysteine protease
VTGLYLRGGSVFIGGAVIGSLLLTATASSAPLQGLWRDVPGSLLELSQWLQRYVPLGGANRNTGIVSFGQNSQVLGYWTSSDDVAFEVQLASTETEDFYWQVGTWATFEGTSWSFGDTGHIDRAAREDLLTGTAEDAVVQAGRREVRFEVTRDRYPDPWVLSPPTIRWVDQAASVRTIGASDYFSTAEVDARTYTVTALVPVFGAEPGGITANRLRVASRDYDAEIRRLYIDNIPDGAIGPEAQAILDEVLARSADNPYDIAITMEAYLKSSQNFRYDTDVVEETADECDGLSTVECFAVIRAGYCVYYASTMAILLRAAGIPTRLAQGFLPGDRDSDGREVVRNSRSHAWVQVYFPGYGWVDRDPTGGNGAGIDAPPSGAPESPTPRPSFNAATIRPFESEDSLGSRPPGTNPGGTNTPPPPQPGPYIAIGALLFIGLLALGYAAWRRGPRPMHPDRAWGSIGRWAARFGLGPRASQTVYEYAGVLGDAMPVVRPELSTVAHAKVEISYGRRELGQDRLRAVAEAHRRLRLGILRLALRRPFRRRGR